MMLVLRQSTAIGGERGTLDDLRGLYEQQRWEDLSRAASGITPPRDPDVEFYHGVALAHLERWTEAQQQLIAGSRAAPRDPRFLVELGGIAFKQRRLAEAAALLRRAAHLQRNDDRYTLDLLGTVYFLQGNIDAALKYWNRIGKPVLAEVRMESAYRTDPVLLDRAFTVAQGGLLRASDLRTTKARIAGLGTFLNPNFRLQGRTDGTFDLDYSALERNAMGVNKWQALASTLRGVGFQTVFPEYFNIRGAAINVESLVRWDHQKRRLRTRLSAPLRGQPQYRWWLAADARDESWELLRNNNASSPSAGTLGLRRTAAEAGIASFPSGDWQWSSTAEVSHRDFRRPAGAVIGESSIQNIGYQLKHTMMMNRSLYRSPERRIESALQASIETGRVWSTNPQLFQKMQVSGTGRWLPQPKGDDYAVRVQLGAGHTAGQVPFDELFVVGVERDNDLWMRAHVGTRGGRKGSAPMGRGYVLFNADVGKNVYDNGLLRVRILPFVDVARITGKTPAWVPAGWSTGTGMQAQVGILGVTATFTYGRDLRFGGNVFYLTTNNR